MFAYEGSRLPVEKAMAIKGFDAALKHLLEQLQALAQVLETQAARDPLLD